MSKTVIDKPIIIALYGAPGSGKTFVGRNLANALQVAHLSADRLRSQLFANPRFDAQENSIVRHLMNYMTEQFLSAGLSVVYDTHLPSSAERRRLRELARKHKADYLLVWLQIDNDSAFTRTQNRDHRTADDRDAQEHTKETFDALVSAMQNPQAEDYVVISGKHAFATQKSAIISRLYKKGLVKSGIVQKTVTRPDLVNLIPSLGSDSEIEPLENYRNISVY